MPLVRYFFFVGGVLLALLFASDAYLPKLQVAERADAYLPVIRIHSDRKWPERIVFDTNHPTVVAAAQLANMMASVPAPVADTSAKTRVREAFAQLQPPDARQQAPDPKQALLSIPRKPEPKPQQRKIAKKRRPPPPIVLVAQQPQFGFFATNTW